VRDNWLVDKEDVQSIVGKQEIVRWCGFQGSDFPSTEVCHTDGYHSTQSLGKSEVIH